MLTLGQVLRLQGRSAEAVDIYQQLLLNQPGHPDALYQWATTLKEQGQPDQAVQIFRQLLERQPDHAEGLTGLGALLAGRGQLDAAMPLLERAVQVRPESAQARHNLGVGHGLTGRPDLARAELEESLRLRPEYPEAWFNLGNILGVLGVSKESEASYRRALALRPDHTGALTNLGLLLQKDDRAGEAVKLLRRVVELRPGAPEGYNNLGLALLEAHRAAEAVTMLRQSVRLNPKYTEANNNLAKAVFNLGRFREAETRFLGALREQPQNAEFHANLGTVLQSAGRHDEALACFDLALMFDPKCVTAHYNRSMSLLSQGRWLEGWADYEYRWGLGGQTERQYRQPRWDGSPLSGKTILIWAEQGLGDMIQFVRYGTLLKQQGARVVLECPPHVVPLFRQRVGYRSDRHRGRSRSQLRRPGTVAELARAAAHHAAERAGRCSVFACAGRANRALAAQARSRALLSDRHLVARQFASRARPLAFRITGLLCAAGRCAWGVVGQFAKRTGQRGSRGVTRPFCRVAIARRGAFRRGRGLAEHRRTDELFGSCHQRGHRSRAFGGGLGSAGLAGRRGAARLALA